MSLVGEPMWRRYSSSGGGGADDASATAADDVDTDAVSPADADELERAVGRVCSFLCDDDRDRSGSARDNGGGGGSAAAALRADCVLAVAMSDMRALQGVADLVHRTAAPHVFLAGGHTHETAALVARALALDVRLESDAARTAATSEVMRQVLRQRMLVPESVFELERLSTTLRQSVQFSVRPLDALRKRWLPDGRPLRLVLCAPPLQQRRLALLAETLLVPRASYTRISIAPYVVHPAGLPTPVLAQLARACLAELRALEAALGAVDADHAYAARVAHSSVVVGDAAATIARILGIAGDGAGAQAP